jgi:hypothetical protein
VSLKVWRLPLTHLKDRQNISIFEYRRGVVRRSLWRVTETYVGWRARRYLIVIGCEP